MKKKKSYILFVMPIILSSFLFLFMMSFIFFLGGRPKSETEVARIFEIPSEFIGIVVEYADRNNVLRAKLFTYSLEKLIDEEMDYDLIFKKAKQRIKTGPKMNEDEQQIYEILKYLDDIEKHPLALKTEYYTVVEHEDENGEIEHEIVYLRTERYSFQLRDDFGEERTFGGEREHMGNDLMSNIGTPIASMTEGVIEAIGWTELGGYRIGITSTTGAYFFYAHMDDFAPGMRKGKRISPGEVIGFVGDTGYGPKGTTGQFAPHLHLQIGTEIDGEMLWMNPYQVLIAFENRRVTLTEFE